MTKIAIYGFGRIGRQLLRVALTNNYFVPEVIVDIQDTATLGALFKVDTNYGVYPDAVTTTQDSITIGEHSIMYFNTKTAFPNWEELGIDLVVDCSGRSTTRDRAQLHLNAGAKYVLISAPSKSLVDADAVLLKGINLENFKADEHKIISMGSCTTNALAPVVKIMQEHFGIQYGLFSTVHSYTNSQSLTDQPMGSIRSSWAAAENIIPSSSGAAKALQFIWKDLKITGKAYRVPTKTGSIAEVNLITEKPCSVEEVRDVFREAAKTTVLNGVLDVLEEEWTSARIVGDAHSSIIDLPLIEKQGEMISVAAWYDNEWGFANRLAEVTEYIAKQITN